VAGLNGRHQKQSGFAGGSLSPTGQSPDGFHFAGRRYGLNRKMKGFMQAPGGY